MRNAEGRIPYATCVLESHLCAGCGRELRGIAAPPDPVYALPVCVCPGCGQACVRRKHRFRTNPVAFRRLDRAFNRLALGAFVLAISAGTSLLIAVFMSLQSERSGKGPFVATLGAIRSAPPEEVLSIGLAVGAVGMVIAISGVMLGRLLRHWKANDLIVGWAVVLIVVSLAPTFVEIVDWDVKARAHDLTSRWPDRLQALAMCWGATALGILIDRSTQRPDGKNHRLRRSLKWARKQQARRRAG